MPKGKSQDKLRRAKRNHIFNIIANGSNVSKIDIKRLSGYSMTSVISIIDELSKQSLITVNESGVSSGGRPPQMINVNPDGGYIIGVDWSREDISCSVFNLCRNRVLSITEPTTDITNITDFVNRLENVINKAINEMKVLVKQFNLLGVGIGVPGYIDDKGNVSRYIHISDYKDVPIREILRQRLKVQVYLENNVNAMALGYKWLKREGNVKSLMVIAVRRGVKAGIIINNHLIKGANDYAGEIGNLKAYPQGKLTRDSGETYEEVLSDYTVISKIDGISSADEIIDKVINGDVVAKDYLEELADVMSELIKYGVALINPEEVLLVGSYVGSDYFIELLNSRVKVNLIGGSAGELGTVGAAGLVIEKLFSY